MDKRLMAMGVLVAAASVAAAGMTLLDAASSDVAHGATVKTHERQGETFPPWDPPADPEPARTPEAETRQEPAESAPEPRTPTEAHVESGVDTLEGAALEASSVASEDEGEAAAPAAAAAGPEAEPEADAEEPPEFTFQPAEPSGAPANPEAGFAASQGKSGDASPGAPDITAPSPPRLPPVPFGSVAGVVLEKVDDAAAEAKCFIVRPHPCLERPLDVEDAVARLQETGDKAAAEAQQTGDEALAKAQQGAADAEAFAFKSAQDAQDQVRCTVERPHACVKGFPDLNGAVEDLRDAADGIEAPCTLKGAVGCLQGLAGVDAEKLFDESVRDAFLRLAEAKGQVNAATHSLPAASIGLHGSDEGCLLLTVHSAERGLEQDASLPGRIGCLAPPIGDIEEPFPAILPWL